MWGWTRPEPPVRPFFRGPALPASLTLLLTGALLASERASRAPGTWSSRSAGSGDPAAPALRFATPELDLGLLEPGALVERPLPWSRAGPGPVRLVALTTSCGCLAWGAGPEGLPEQLGAGDQGTARLRLRAPTRPGPVDLVARVVLDLPAPEATASVRVRGFVGGVLVVEPESVDLGRRTAGSRVPLRWAVHLPPGLEGAPVVAALTPWSGTVRAVGAALVRQRGPDLEADLHLPLASGPATAALRVEAPGAGAVVVPLRAVLVPTPGRAGARR